MDLSTVQWLWFNVANLALSQSINFAFCLFRHFFSQRIWNNTKQEHNCLKVEHKRGRSLQWISAFPGWASRDPTPGIGTFTFGTFASATREFTTVRLTPTLSRSRLWTWLFWVSTDDTVLSLAFVKFNFSCTSKFFTYAELY